MPPTRPSVLIVAHGSSVSDDAQEAAKQHALTLQQSNRYGRVDVCFLAGERSEPDLPGGEVFLLPFFMSNGYFVTRRIPELFKLNKGQHICADRQLFQCEALGIDPELAGIISSMARGVCVEQGYRPTDIHLVLVAHGSEKSTASAEATYLQRKTVDSGREFARVSAAFLNEAPFLDQWLQDQSESGLPLVLVGLFAADGPHATEDVPGAIAKWQEETGSTLPAHYAGAIGTRPEIVRLIQHSISRCAAKFSEI
ncbi:CbiX/SirB N-terminal domain-containing protein [Sneathiella sp.]|uniref:CbiX/SirB N-terminal domain-containing protein n=1 Tax=Sneathiella sp. TaxID=1964365 RepID=UPI002623C29E|nr:CbiX/SirB N-terminal domain-containing protein [Sneathiella sp.]MDF2367444.1 CbiX/SirB N-terminal domain-containing protein [Sneathiella sp.]